jgi:hypothetical protein
MTDSGAVAPGKKWQHIYAGGSMMLVQTWKGCPTSEGVSNKTVGQNHSLEVKSCSVNQGII